jgi:UDP-N-acetylmuramate dehydrogenase
MKKIKISECKVSCKEPLSKHSYWKIGGEADILVEPLSIQGLSNALHFSSKYQNKPTIFGSGSNLLFDDRGIRGIVIKIGNKLSGYEVEGRRIIAESGLYVPFLARISQSTGLTGIEHIVGIPGTIGGLVVMNGGSMRRGIGENIDWVEVINFEGEKYSLDRQECNFKYRDSIFHKKQYIITRLQLTLEYGDKSEIRDRMLNILESRNKKFPRKLPTCGSVFLSSPEIYERMGPPGYVIESLGFKGRQIGDAQVSHIHANFIVNLGNASHRDVLELVKLVNEECIEKFGFSMKAEAKYITQDGRESPLNEAAKLYI